MIDFVLIFVKSHAKNTCANGAKNENWILKSGKKNGCFSGSWLILGEKRL